jgi:hypothetical protein
MKWISAWLLFAGSFLATPGAGASRWVNESARKVPVAYEVDVLVAGGSTGAVAAAIAAARQGARVFLAAQEPYLGEDLCGTMRLWLEPGETPESPLARKLFSREGLMSAPGPMVNERGPFRPAHIKKTLDDALLAAGVQFLYGTYVTGILRDEKNGLAGALIVNRAGRQAVLARTIIDATEYASVARLAGAQTTSFPAGEQQFHRVVVGGPVKNSPLLTARKTGLAFVTPTQAATEDTPATESRTAELIEYIFRLPMADDSYQERMAAEHRGRELTNDPEMEADTDSLFQVPPYQAVTEACNEGTGVTSLGCFQPKGQPGIYLVSGMAGVSRSAAGRLLRPLALLAAGDMVGTAAGKIAQHQPKPEQIALQESRREPTTAGDVMEILSGLRPTETPQRSVMLGDTSVPVLGQYDVVVVGGGTGGSPAGIAAGNSGAHTLVVEYLHGLGGVGTMGRITLYWRGYRGGFTRRVGGGEEWNALEKEEWWREALLSAGTEVWFGVLGCGAFVENKTVKGVVLATPFGRGVVLAKTVVDSTGNADIAAAAGAQVVQTGESEVAWQGTGLPAIRLGGGYHNTDFTITDETDVLDTWHMLVYAKDKYTKEFDIGQLVDSRERRRVVGDFEMTELDEMMSRHYPDTISVTWTDYDTHGYTVAPYFLLEQPKLKQNIFVYLPYRCLLPKGLDHILVTGLGISVRRDALPLVRMQADVQNQGYAAGLAAAMAAENRGGDVRAIDIQRLQKRLAIEGNIPEGVIGDKDNYPLPEEAIAQAVAELPTGQIGSAAILLKHPEESSRLLRAALAKADKASDKSPYAMALAALGDKTGLDPILDGLRDADWDRGWEFTGMGQYGSSMSPIDKMIVAAGRLRDKKALQSIVRLARQLTPKSEFSHYRAVTQALEWIGDPSAAPVLVDLLGAQGVRGHVERTVENAREQSGLNPKDETTRSRSLRELGLARALYHCGDYHDLGRGILQEYTHDLRGHLARHARAVLEQPPVHAQQASEQPATRQSQQTKQ